MLKAETSHGSSGNAATESGCSDGYDDRAEMVEVMSLRGAGSCQLGTRTLFYFFCLLFYSCILNFFPIIPILCPIILEIQSTFLHYNDNNNQSYDRLLYCTINDASI